MINIVQKENSILREIARDIPLADITSKRVERIIADMKQAIAEQDDAVAIAAPQIGESLRIFVISGKVFLEEYPEADEIDPNDIPPDLVCINPKIIKLSKDKKKMSEGCLSVRWLYGKVRRATRASISAYDEHGKSFTRGASGLLAQIFQHEIDHLDGILFIDTADEIEEIPPEKQKEVQRELNEKRHEAKS